MKQDTGCHKVVDAGRYNDTEDFDSQSYSTDGQQYVRIIMSGSVLVHPQLSVIRGYSYE